MRRRRQPSAATVFVLALAFSAAIHLLLGFPFKTFVEGYLSSGSDREPPVRMVQVSPEQWSRNFQTQQERSGKALNVKAPDPTTAKKADDTAEAIAKKAEAEKKREPVKPDRQVVDVPPTADDTPNDKAKFLSKHNTNVDKESVARLEERDHTKRRTTNRLQTKDEPVAPKTPSIKTKGLSVKGDGLPKDVAGKAGDDRFELKMPDIMRRDEVKLGLGLDGDPMAITNRSATEGLIGNSDHFQLKLGSTTGPEGDAGGKKGAKDGAKNEQPLPTLSALVPALGRAARLSGSPSMDHIEGVPEGDGTFLNTKEFKYATFIHRVSDSVYPYWDSFLHTEYRRRDPTRRIYGTKDRATVVSLELNLSGEVAGLHVSESSGVEFLDDVIVRAIRKASPFPNPPEAMADDDGVIRLNYRFVVVLRPGSGSLFRRLR